MNVIVGMSGGVDSSVAAKLLVDQGHDVTGVFMQNWQADRDDPHCLAEVDLSDARAVCDKIGIPLKTVSFASEYWDRVFQYFLDEYSAGRTPNPDILCNKEIKFKAFLDYAIDSGADAIATGHYVRRGDHDEGAKLLRGLDNNKDQSYFLYTITQHALTHALFPVGELTKPQVRAIAEQNGFITHNKKDSTGICFIGERKFTTFLNEYLLAKPGNIKTVDGNKIGEHQGLMFYTLGQRQGLQLGGIKNYREAPWYVLQKNIDQNELIVGQDHDHPLLMLDYLECDQLHWVAGHTPKNSFECTAKIRYRHQDNPCSVQRVSDDRWTVKFNADERAITPGQSIVFYDNDICLGGGVIL